MILEASRKDYSQYTPLRREEGGAEGRSQAWSRAEEAGGGILPMQVF